MNGLSPNPFMDQKYYSDFNDNYSTTNGIVRFVKDKRRWQLNSLASLGSWEKCLLRSVLDGLAYDREIRAIITMLN